MFVIATSSDAAAVVSNNDGPLSVYTEHSSVADALSRENSAIGVDDGSLFSEGKGNDTTTDGSARNGSHNDTGIELLLREANTYQLLPFASLRKKMLSLAKMYPNYVKVFTSQQRYGLKQAGAFPNYVMVIEDYTRHHGASKKELKNSLPEVFLSGALHGNERVGPTATFETARLLIFAAACQAGGSSPSTRSACSAMSAYKKSTPWVLPWLARLVSTRRTVVVPMTNAWGYANNQREEIFYDPNRDFSYDQDPGFCMRTIAGRTVNEVWRESLFQLSLTYHSGIELIGWEWGSTNRLISGGLSPDHNGQKQLTENAAKYSGKFSGTPMYKTGSINNGLIYPVRGGFEDWAYAGSWDKSGTTVCKPSSYGGYPAMKTTYNKSTLRSFNLLVETSNQKTPVSKLGTRQGLFNPSDAGNGHVPRNIRLALMNVDVVEPYAIIRTVGGKNAGIDVPTGVSLDPRWCITMRNKVISYRSRKSVKINWTVGGAFTVDETRLVVARWGDVPEKIGCVAQQTSEKQYLQFIRTKNVFRTKMKKGVTRWKNAGKFSGRKTPDPLFSQSINLSKFKKGAKVAVYAVAMVDQEWKKRPGKVQPNVGPQSHVVNARTNPNWYHKIGNGKFVRGRLHWISVPITISIK